MDLARDRLFRRLEKFLITIESILVSGWMGVCLFLSAYLFFERKVPVVEEAKTQLLKAVVFGFIGILVLAVFIIVIVYKRHVIKNERGG